MVESLATGSGPTRILVDCGLGLKEVCRRLEDRGLAASDLDAIFVTHEHQDHIGGVARLARHADIPVLASHGTVCAQPKEFWADVRVIEIDSHAVLPIGELTVHCYPVPHDAREPVQLVVASGQHRLGVLTDVGRSTPHIESMLSGSDALFLEANHDEALLACSDYPASLKQRIAGPFGHLSNHASAAILAAIDRSRLQHVVAAHLSRQNNQPQLVEQAFSEVLESGICCTIASQDGGVPWIALD